MAASSRGGRAASMSPEELERHRREAAEVSRRLGEASARAVQAQARVELASSGVVQAGDSAAQKVARLRQARAALTSGGRGGVQRVARVPGDWDVPDWALGPVRQFREDYRRVAGAWVREGWHSREEVVEWLRVIKEDMQHAMSAHFAIDPRPQAERIEAWCGTFRRLALEMEGKV